MATVTPEGARTHAAGRPALWHVSLLFAALTVLLTWPQVCRLESIPNNMDAWFNMWRVGWIAHQLPRAPWDLFDANIFYPAARTLAYSDAVLLQGILGAPLIWVGVPIVVVYNLLVLASFVLCGVGTFLLVRDLTGRADAAVLAGIVFAFAPFRFDHYFHLELLWGQWMPFTLWMVHRTLRSGRLRDGILTGLFLAAQVLSCIYYAVFFATALAVVGPLLVVFAPTKTRRRAALALAGGLLVCAALGVPYFVPYRSARAEVGERAEDVARSYSAGARDYLATVPDSVVYGPVTGQLGTHEKRLFPGFAALVLAGIAIVVRKDRVRLAYALFGLLSVAISFGPRGVLFAWLRHYVLFYRGLRVPARAGQLALLACAIFAGYGMAYLAERQWWRRWGVSAVGALIVVEYLSLPLNLVPVPTRPSGVYRWLSTQPQAPVIELPLASAATRDVNRFWPWHDPEYQYLSTFHWQPLINGYSGEIGRAYLHLLEQVGRFPDGQSVDTLEAFGARYFVVHERFYGIDTYHAVTAALDQRPDLVAFGSFDDYGHQARVYGVRETSEGNE